MKVEDLPDELKGLSPEEAPRIFSRFYRGAQAREGSSGGLGLGLSIARALAQGMGGTLAYAPRRGGGSVFSLVLPARCEM
jgi:two-component system OmpR family sensor kinase